MSMSKTFDFIDAFNSLIPPASVIDVVSFKQIKDTGGMFQIRRKNETKYTIEITVFGETIAGEEIDRVQNLLQQMVQRLDVLRGREAEQKEEKSGDLVVGLDFSKLEFKISEPEGWESIIGDPIIMPATATVPITITGPAPEEHHPSTAFATSGVTTGRFSARRGAFDPFARKPIKLPSGFEVHEEMRKTLTAEDLEEAYRKLTGYGEDIHTRMAREMFGVAEHLPVTPKQRNAAKVRQFAELYSKPLPIALLPAPITKKSEGGAGG